MVNRLGGGLRAKITFCHLHSNRAPCQRFLFYIFVCRIISPNFADYLLLFNPELAKYTCQNFKLHFVENKASYGKVLFYIFDLFFHTKFPSNRLHRLTDRYTGWVNKNYQFFMNYIFRDINVIFLVLCCNVTCGGWLHPPFSKLCIATKIDSSYPLFVSFSIPDPGSIFIPIQRLVGVVECSCPPQTFVSL